MRMKLGLYGINLGPCVDPESASSVARAAENAGFESLWTAEHVVLPDPQVPPSPVPPETLFLDPAVALSHVAAHTRTIRLATGIIILPQRNPLVLAKEMASVDVLSGGRLIFGVGAGYLRPEFDALGAPFEDRGERTNEYIEAIRALWTQEAPHFEGRLVSFAGIDAQPRPIQKPHPPIVIGGHSPPALRRAARQGNGWYGFALDLDATADCVAGLRAAQQEVERPADLGRLEISVTPSVPLDADTLRRFQDAGVDRLVPLALAGSAEDLIAFVERTADALLTAR
jgi:probable F420-dependent oxidoreductase